MRLRIKNINRLAAAIETQSVPGFKFDMNHVLTDYEDGCYTAGCIVGWTVAIGKGKLPDFADLKEVHDRAKAFLGINEKLAWSLFYPASELPRGVSYDDISPAIAAKCLRLLAKTGKVQWKKAMKT